MRRLGVVFLDRPDPEGQALGHAEADIILAWDREADDLGAPQNVAALHSLISLGKPVWYRGGMETVHTAELILGLGCEKVLVGTGFFRTERMPEHFVRRLGEACVVVANSQSELERAVAAGAAWAYCSFVPAPLPGDVAVVGEAGFEGAWGVAESAQGA